MRVLVVVCLVVASLSAHAAVTDVGILPPTGATPEEAAQLTSELTSTLTLRSLSVTDPALIARMLTLGCEAQDDACLADVAREAESRKLLRARVTKADRSYAFQLAMFDAASGKLSVAPQLVTADFNAGLNGARVRLLELLQPGSQKGILVVKGAGFAVSVDGVVVDTSGPVRLGIGPHTLEATAPDRAPLSHAFNVEADVAVEIAVCVDATAVVVGDTCAAAAAPPTQPLPVLAIAGGAGLGIGVITLGVSGAFAAMSGAARDQVRFDPDTQVVTDGTKAELAAARDHAVVATTLLVVGTAFTGIGGGVLVASVLTGE